MWPNSLRSRLLLVILTGLILALLISSFIHWQDRGRSFRHISTDHYIDRVVAAVTLIDSSNLRQRRMFFKKSYGRPFEVRLLPRFEQEFIKDRSNVQHAIEVEERLIKALGEQYRVNAFRLDKARQKPSKSNVKNKRKHLQPQHSLLISTIQLTDGSAVRFISRLPPRFGKWSIGLISSIIILIVMASLLFWVAIRFVSKPLKLVNDQAGRLQIDLDAEPLSENGPYEIQQLAKAMNGMQSGLQDLFQQRNRFLAAVSHDLRTPITRLYLRLENINDPLQKALMEKDLKDMELLINETLEFIRTDRKKMDVNKINVYMLIESEISKFASTTLSIRLQGHSDIFLMARESDISRCFLNIFSNSSRYATNVYVKLSDDGNDVTIVIEDNGPGVDEEIIPRLTEPYFRGDSSRGEHGNGLGLSIVENIVKSHQGELIFYNCRNIGFGVKIRFPKFIE